jgi:hypothetical protein
MDPDVRQFAQVMAVLVPSMAIMIGVVVVAIRAIRSKPTHHAPPPLDDARLARLEQAVDAIALEMERVGEGQRYLTQIMAQRVAQGTAQSGPQNVLEARGRIITPH